MSSYYTATDVVSPNSFMMFPKELLKDRFSELSLDAKVLYSVLLDRVSLSIKNQLVDVNGNVYVISKQTEIQELLGCAKQKVQKMFKELENFNLIDRKKQGSNLPDLIFVKKLSTDSVDKHVDNISRDENHSRPSMKIIRHCGMKISPVNNTNTNNTELSDTKSIYPVSEEPKDNAVVQKIDGWIDSSNARSVVCDQIDYEAIDINLEDASVKLALNNIVSLMTEVYSQNYRKIKVNGELRSYVDLRDRFVELNQFHIEYVLECIAKRNASAEPITNLKAYLATALYNAPATMNDYYAAQARYLQSKSAATKRSENYDDLDALAW